MSACIGFISVSYHIAVVAVVASIISTSTKDMQRSLLTGGECLGVGGQRDAGRVVG